MKPADLKVWFETLVVGAAALAACATAASSEPHAAGAAEREFLARNDTAMAAMHAGMQIRPQGDIDEDFAAIMIPHHEGAIDMAALELRYGRNERLRRIAQAIIVGQQQEIAAMRLAFGQPPPAFAPAPNPRF